jgi:hypothetical protein
MNHVPYWEPQVLGATVQNLVAKATQVPGIWASLIYQTVWCHKLKKRSKKIFSCIYQRCSIHYKIHQRECVIWQQFFFFFLGPVCISSGSTAAFKAYCALTTVTWSVTKKKIKCVDIKGYSTWGCFRTGEMILGNLLYPTHLMRT